MAFSYQEIQSIYVSSDSYRMKVYDGSPFDFSQLKIFAKDINGYSREVTDYSLTNADVTEVGTHLITATYQDYTCSFYVCILSDDMNADSTALTQKIVDDPTIVLGKRSGEKLGFIPALSFNYSHSLNAADEISFTVHKYANGVLCALWDEIDNFKTVWYKAKDIWFEIYVETNDTDETVKNVTGTALSEAELSQVYLYEVEINTENDITREDYEVTTFYNATNPKASILNKIIDKVPNFKIAHVDASLMHIQRVFSFDEVSIYDALQEIATELNCLFLFGSGTDNNGKIARTISVYDLEVYCPICGKRYELLDLDSHSDTNCQGVEKDFVYPYGEDTNIFITTENLANEITFTSDTSSIKNCFRLLAGDDLMTATIRNYNLSGSNYLWYFSDALKKELPEELRERIDAYDRKYRQYSTGVNQYGDSVILGTIDKTIYSEYIKLVEKYPDKLSHLPSNEVTSYQDLLEKYYDLIDFNLYLTSEMMPKVELSLNDIKTELSIALATFNSNIQAVSVQDIKVASQSTVTSAVEKAFETCINTTRYKVDATSSSYANSIWKGKITLTARYENEDGEKESLSSVELSIQINENYESYIRQKIEILLKKDEYDNEIYDISTLFDCTIATFTDEIKKYCLNRLNSFRDSCEEVLNLMMEQGIPNKDSSILLKDEIYNNIYMDYYNKMQLLEKEIGIRTDEISVINGTYDSNSKISKEGMITQLSGILAKVQSDLDFESNITNNGQDQELWDLLISYRREDTYKNENYISDGLSNKELLEKASDYMLQAKKEIFKSSTLQHSISSTLKNIFNISKFAPLLSSFRTGNWLRVKIDDNIYLLRLIGYAINYDDLENIEVTFSDVRECPNGIDDIKSILNQATSMSSSYNAVSRQASKAEDAARAVSDIVNNGLSLTKSKIVDDADNQTLLMTKNGFLCRRKKDLSDDYEEKQMKIINSGAYLTDDNWRSIRTAIGDFIYYDPVQKMEIESYGVIADTLVGHLMLSDKVWVYSKDLSTKLDSDGLTMTGAIKTNLTSDYQNFRNFIYMNPNKDSIVRITKEEVGSDGELTGNLKKLLYTDEKGNLNIEGYITATGLILSSNSIGIDSKRAIFADLNGVYIDADGNACVNADYMKIGKIVDKAGKVEWDLEKGTFYMSNSAMIRDENGDIVLDSEGNPVTVADFSTTEQVTQSIKVSNGTLESSIQTRLGDYYTKTQIEQTAKLLKLAYEKGTTDGLGNYEDSALNQLFIGEDGVFTQTQKQLGNYALTSYVDQKADSITSTVAKYQGQYDFTGVDVDLYGYGEPKTETYPPSEYSGKYYFDQSSGKLYLSNGTAWSLDKTLNLVSSILQNQISTIDQKADSIELSVSNAISDANKYTDGTAKYQAEYDFTDVTIDLCGYEAPKADTYPPSDYNGKYYFDQSSGNLYLSNGTTWNFVKTLTSISSQLKANYSSIKIDVDSIMQSVTQINDNLQENLIRDGNFKESSIDTYWEVTCDDGGSIIQTTYPTDNPEDCIKLTGNSSIYCMVTQKIKIQKDGIYTLNFKMAGSSSSSLQCSFAGTSIYFTELTSSWENRKLIGSFKAGTEIAIYFRVMSSYVYITDVELIGYVGSGYSTSYINILKNNIKLSVEELGEELKENFILDDNFVESDINKYWNTSLAVKSGIVRASHLDKRCVKISATGCTISQVVKITKSGSYAFSFDVSGTPNVSVKYTVGNGTTYNLDDSLGELSTTEYKTESREARLVAGNNITVSFSITIDKSVSSTETYACIRSIKLIGYSGSGYSTSYLNLMSDRIESCVQVGEFKTQLIQDYDGFTMGWNNSTNNYIRFYSKSICMYDTGATGVGELGASDLTPYMTTRYGYNGMYVFDTQTNGGSSHTMRFFAGIPENTSTANPTKSAEVRWCDTDGNAVARFIGNNLYFYSDTGGSVARTQFSRKGVQFNDDDGDKIADITSSGLKFYDSSGTSTCALSNGFFKFGSTVFTNKAIYDTQSVLSIGCADSSHGVYIGNANYQTAIYGSYILINGAITGTQAFQYGGETRFNRDVTFSGGSVFWYSSKWNDMSDARLKTNIADVSLNALSILNKIELKSYDWIESGDTVDIGIIAQQLNEIAPNLVSQNNKTGALSIKTFELIMYLIKAVQELSKNIFDTTQSETTEKWVDPYTSEEKTSFIEEYNAILNQDVVGK